MHQAPRSSDENVAGVTASADEAVEGRKFIRKITSLIIVAGAVLITLYVWGIIERHPRTDDATARANVVGIAPRVAGQIIKPNVQDNQAVKEGDVLFEIDPEDYRLVLEKAKADLAALDRQIAQAGSSLQRLEPLLPKKFTTAENVDEARRRDRSASLRGTLCEARTELGASSTTFPRPDRSRESRSQPVSHGRISRCDYRRTASLNELARACGE